MHRSCQSHGKCSARCLRCLSSHPTVLGDYSNQKHYFEITIFAFADVLAASSRQVAPHTLGTVTPLSGAPPDTLSMQRLFVCKES